VTATALGVALAVAGSGIALRAALLLGGRGRPRRGERPAFVVAGPYLRARNPLLGGAILALTGAALVAASWVAAAAVLVAGLVAADLWVRHVEEPALRARFGDAYVEYVRRVPRWLPAPRARGRAPSAQTGAGTT
jgi:protein-S-isoprenylcysteine O-methyltransferase Ste14